MTNHTKSWGLTIVVAVAGVLLTLATVRGVQEATDQHDRDRFNVMVDNLELEIENRVQQYQNVLENYRGLFLASNEVEYKEFYAMYSSSRLQESYPGALGVGFIEPVANTPEAQEDFRNKLLAEGSPDFQIHCPAGTSNQPENYRLKQRLLIRIVEPHENNKQALGLDIGAEVNRREAAEKSFYHKKPAITRVIQLVQSNRKEAGFLYLVPVFKPAEDLSKPDRFLGWVYMPIVAQKAIEGVQKRTNNELVFEILTGGADHSDLTICKSPFRQTSGGQTLHAERDVKIGDQVWRLHAATSTQYGFYNPMLETMVLPVGLLLTLALAVVVRVLTSQATRANDLARKMTEETRHLALVAQRTINPVILTDIEGKMVWANEAFTKLTGYEVDEVVGIKPGHLLQCEETDPTTVEEIRECLRECRGFSGEIYNRSRHGRGYWLLLDIQPMYDEDGTHIGFLAIETDVTLRREAARLLEEETNRTNLALDNGRLATWDWNMESDQLVLDDRWEGIFGPYDEAEGQFGQYWEKRLHPDDVAAHKKVLEEALHTDVIEGEWRYRNSEDEYLWILVRGTIVHRASDGRPLKLSGTIMEITSRKMAEEALRISEARSKAMFERSNEAIFLFNEESFVDLNPKTLELFGYESREEFIKFHPAQLSPPNQPDGRSTPDVAIEKIANVNRDGFARFEWMHKRKSGELFHADVSLTLLIQGSELLYMGIVRDISERKELERQLSQAQKLESIGQLAAGVAHEINTPMQCVFSNIEYLQGAFDRIWRLTEAYRQLDREGWSNEVRTSIEKIEKRSRFDSVKNNITEATAESGEAARRVIDIVRAMKTMSHPGTADKVHTNLNKLVEDASIIARNRWKYAAKLENELDPDLPEIPLLPAQMSQVMLNLIVNAADAIVEKLGDDPSELGQIFVRTRHVGNEVMIQVQDSGNGIPNHVKKRIFDPFFTTKEVGKGTGQGLSIAYDVVVNQLDGRIEVESEPGEGTTFTIWLPMTELTCWMI